MPVQFFWKLHHCTRKEIKLVYHQRKKALSKLKQSPLRQTARQHVRTSSKAQEKLLQSANPVLIMHTGRISTRELAILRIVLHLNAQTGLRVFHIGVIDFHLPSSRALVEGKRANKSEKPENCWDF